ncbi:hypothetical protein JCM33374_g5933 [Metschnikowia sp. JCM 33374]|nr:hypothetical protein JCM33374_g5933 [Metschnikowia sp. JCM 33374]
MSYQQVPTQPPAYGEDPATRTAGDNIPDDFKYSVNVASCELSVRQMFVRKVYALLSVQIFATVFVGYLIRSHEPLRNWCLNNMWFYIVSVVGAFGFAIAANIKARSYPINLILLAGFTVCEAYGIGLACSFVETDAVVQALLITFVLFIGLTAFAFQSKYDFTSWQGVLGISVWALIAIGFVNMFFPGNSKGFELLYSAAGALVFSGYILVDTQHLMKTFSLDDEVSAAIALYLDILNLFLFILRLMSNRNND